MAGNERASRFRKGVFVSYSHKDQKWLDELKTALAPLTRDETIDLWDDSRILPGSGWESEILNAIQRSRVAVLLVSQDFLASDYPVFEMKMILEQRSSGLTAFWVPLTPALYEHTPLGQIQAAYNPATPLNTLTRPERQEALVQIARRIAQAVDLNAVANAFKIIDDFTPQLDAFIKRAPEPVEEVSHHVMAQQHNEQISFNTREGKTLEVIHAKDLMSLDGDHQKLIRAYERTMKELFERWVELKPKRISRDPEIAREACEESEKVRGQLCHELQELLAFIASLGKSLYDHYSHVQFICQQK
jgi:hypothetical protein